MSGILLSLLTLFKGSPGAGTSYDAASPLPYLAIGLVAILVIAAAIVVIIVFSVKRLKRIRNKNNNPPQ
jgi:hypothetical protein